MMIKMLNMMIFRREFTRKMPRTKTVDHTLRKPAQSNCTWTCHKSHFAQKLQVKCRGPKPQTTLCANLRIRNALGHFTRATFVREFFGKMPGTKAADHTLREPAVSKCTWTLHKCHFAREFTGKMPRAKTGDHTLREPARSK